MAVLLGAGDSFHLIPRCIALWTSGLEANAAALGTGKFITSITMTIFYLIMGIIIIIIFSRETKRADDRVFRFMPLAVILSFGFYLPVVLFSGIAPAVGVLMIPKTLAYVWIVLMGWQLYRQSAEKKESLLRRSAL